MEEEAEEDEAAVVLAADEAKVAADVVAKARTTMDNNRVGNNKVPVTMAMHKVAAVEAEGVAGVVVSRDPPPLSLSLRHQPHQHRSH